MRMLGASGCDPKGEGVQVCRREPLQLLGFQANAEETTLRIA